jgi:hypothetical protein
MVDANDSDSKNIFIGIVGGPTSRAASVAILDNARRSVVAASFFLEEAPPQEYLTDTAHGITFVETPDCSPVTAFLTAHVPQGSSLGVLVEAPRVTSLADKGKTPAAVFPRNSVLFKLLCSLCFQGFGLYFAYYEVPERESIVAHYVTSQDAGGTQILAQPRFLAKNISQAFGELLFEIHPSVEQSAAIAALIAKNHGAYYYWSSFGTPPSSGDIVACLRSGTTRTLVGTPSEMFAMRFGRTREGLEEDVPLEFALACKTWEHLGENDAIKAALVHVSKLFNFDIRCDSSRIDAQGRNPRLVYPLPKEDDWVAVAIKSEVWGNRE